MLEIEANGVTDNPLVFEDTGEIISGGNFHAEPVAMAADNLALAIAELGAISERRIALLIDSNLSKLPPFLVENGGVNSGFMIAQVTAAALASENKTFAHPLCRQLADLGQPGRSCFHGDLCSPQAQGYGGKHPRSAGSGTAGRGPRLDFRAPLQPSPAVAKAKAELRERVAFYDKDRYFGPDITKATELLASGRYNAYLPKELLPSSL